MEGADFRLEEKKVVKIIKMDQDSLTIDRGMKGQYGFSCKIYGDFSDPEFINKVVEIKKKVEERLGLENKETV